MTRSHWLFVCLVAIGLTSACKKDSDEGTDTDTDTDSGPSTSGVSTFTTGSVTTFTTGSYTTSAGTSFTSTGSTTSPTGSTSGWTSSTTMDETDGDTAMTGTTGGSDPGNCCDVRGESGCENATVEACVCAAEPFCCENPWDAVCVLTVMTAGCGVCGTGDCCTASTSPSCEDPEIAGCVCNEDIDCCTTAWDQMCVQGVTEHACGMCN